MHRVYDSPFGDQNACILFIFQFLEKKIIFRENTRIMLSAIAWLKDSKKCPPHNVQKPTNTSYA